jgi:hypothetical protein
MARYVTSITTALTAEEAFAYMADINHFSEWDPGVTAVRRVTGDGFGVGVSYDLDVKTIGTTVMRYVVHEYDAPRRILLVANTTFLTSVDEISVTVTDTGCTVTYDAQLTLNGPLRVLDPILRRAFRIIGDRGANGLRRALSNEACR